MPRFRSKRGAAASEVMTEEVLADEVLADEMAEAPGGVTGGFPTDRARVRHAWRRPIRRRTLEDAARSRCEFCHSRAYFEQKMPAEDRSSLRLRRRLLRRRVSCTQQEASAENARPRLAFA